MHPWNLRLIAVIEHEMLNLPPEEARYCGLTPPLVRVAATEWDRYLRYGQEESTALCSQWRDRMIDVNGPALGVAVMAASWRIMRILVSHGSTAENWPEMAGAIVSTLELLNLCAMSAEALWGILMDTAIRIADRHEQRQIYLSHVTVVCDFIMGYALRCFQTFGKFDLESELDALKLYLASQPGTLRPVNHDQLVDMLNLVRGSWSSAHGED